MSVLKLAPNFDQKTEVLFKLAVIFGKTYQLDQAINYFKLCLSELEETLETNKRIDIHTKIGICYEAKKEYEEALKSYEAALDLNKKDNKTLLHMAWCNCLLQRHSKAIEYTNMVLAPKNLSSDAYYIKGRVLLDLKRYTEAQECFNHALAQDQKNVIFLNSLGIAKCQVKDFTGACIDFSNAIGVNQKRFEIWLNIGMMYEMNDKYSEADNAYKQGLGFAPNMPQLVNRKEALKGEKKLGIEFVHLDYHVGDSMVPDKSFMNNPFLKKGAEVCSVQGTTLAINGSENKLRISEKVGKEKAKEDVKISRKEAKKEIEEVKIILNEKPAAANGVKNAQSKPIEEKPPTNSKTKNNGNTSKSAHPKSKSAPENPPNQHPAPQSNIPAEYNSIPLQQLNMLQSQLPMQAMMNPYDMRSQASNPMMAYYMQNPMLAPRYSIVANPYPMSFVSTMSLQRPPQSADVSSLYQLPGMPQGSVMVMAPYSLPNASQMTRPDSSPFVLSMPRPSFISPEQYQEQASSLQRAGQASGGLRPISSHPMISPSFYPMIGGYSARAPGRFPEGFIGDNARGIDLQRMGYSEEHAEPHNNQRQPEQSRAIPPEHSRSGLKKPRYE